MKKNFGKKTYLFPMPVLIIGTYDKDNRANVMNAAWGGIHDTNQVAICLSTDHKTTENIIAKKAFTIAFADKNHVAESDYFGLVSGNDGVDKLGVTNMHAIKSEFVDAPVIEEYPLTIECTVASLRSDDQGTTFVVGDIVNVLADEKILNDEGKIDAEKAGFISYDSAQHRYMLVSGAVGKAFTDGKKYIK